MNSQKELEFQLPKGKRQLQVEVRIRFGNPKFGDCRNFGICKMELASDRNSSLKKKQQWSRAILKKEKEDLWIYFIKASMDEKTRALNFGRGFFLIEKRKKISGEIVEELEMEYFIFNHGKYAYLETVDHLIVRITSFGSQKYK